MDAFNGALISALSPDRRYRVYANDGQLFFIQIGGQGLGTALAASFGALGMLIYGQFQRRAQAKLEARIRELDMQPPSSLLAQGKHNLCVAASDVESSTLQAASALGGSLGGHGQHYGRWILQARGKKMTVQLESEDDMRRAFAMLPRAIRQHANQVSWDGATNKFTKV